MAAKKKRDAEAAKQVMLSERAFKAKWGKEEGDDLASDTGFAPAPQSSGLGWGCSWTLGPTVMVSVRLRLVMVIQLQLQSCLALTFHLQHGSLRLGELAGSLTLNPNPNSNPSRWGR